MSERHDYVSTACQHDLHHACRQQCKFCTSRCRCVCHIPAPTTPDHPVSPAHGDLGRHSEGQER